MARSNNNNGRDCSSNGDYYAKSREIPRGSHGSHDSRHSKKSRGSSTSSIPRHSQSSHHSNSRSRSSHDNKAAATSSSSSSTVPPGKKRVDTNGGYNEKNRWMNWNWNWNQTGAETDADGLTQDELDLLIPALAWKSYHLPGNSYWADWCQYFCNNHPVFGICCHHRLHPIRWPVRILHLLGSFIFGLLMTNMIWLWFLYSQEHDENTVMVTVSVNGDVVNVTNTNLPQTVQDIVSEQGEMQITEGMALLWTVGSASHALFDNIIWYLTACSCCVQPGQSSLENLARYKKYGIGLVIFTVIGLASVATFVVVLRATLQNDENAAEELQELEDAGLYQGTDTALHDIESKSDFQFLISYSVELCLALFVYYPIIATILFSGFFGCCGRIPVLGGRAYEMRLEQVRIQRQEQEEEQRQASEKRVRQQRRSGGRRPNNNNNNSGSDDTLHTARSSHSRS